MSLPSELGELKARLVDALPPTERATIEHRLGEIHARLGELDQALLHLGAARKLYETLGNRSKTGQVDLLIGATCVAKGEHERAARCFERARNTATSLGDEDLTARVETAMGEAALARGETDRARDHLERARRHFEKFWDGAELARIYAALASMASDRGEAEEAARLSDKALEDAEAAGDPLFLGRALLARAFILERGGDLRGAKRFYRRAINTLQEHELAPDLAQAYLRYGLFVGEATKTMPEAFTDPPAFWLAKAQAIFRDLGYLRDLEQVREAFRRYGRRATDRVSEVEVLHLLQELKQSRLEVQRESHKLAERTLDWFDRVQGVLPQEMAAEADTLRRELARAERALARGADQMALSEEKFLGALNTVIVERENIRTLLELCRSLNAVQDYARLPGDIAKMAAQLTGADRALVALVGEDGKLQQRGTVRIAEGETGHFRRALEAAITRAGAPALLQSREDAKESGRDKSSREMEQTKRHEEMRLGFAMVCPLRHGEKIYGAIWVDKELCGGVFTERDLDLLSIFAAQAATILENGRVLEENRLAARTRAATLEAISDGVLSLSPDGRVTSINSTAARILGLGATPPSQLRLASLPELSFLGGMLARGEETDGRVVRLPTGDFLLNARCIRGDAREILGLVATLTEMKRATSLAQRIVGSTARFTFGDIIGGSPALRRRLQLAEAAARSDSNVLITGESGTGKELMAQAIHNAGPRANGPFVGINCAAIPRELLESELFGYEAGAFTGAKKGGHPGKFELAEGGTILLDEIGDMPLEMQAKLLRVLQEKRVQRLGGTREIPLDARIIATTNRDLAEEAERGRFRQDLLFRLRVIHIELPPLRERREDIPMLVEHFLALFSARLGKTVRGVTPEVMQVLQSYPWPGNVRELEHVLEGEVNLAAPDQELLREIPVMLEIGARRQLRMPPPIVGEPAASGMAYGGRYGASVPPGAPGFGPAGSSLPGAPTLPLEGGPSTGGIVSIAESERQLLLAALVAHRGSVPEVAKALGVSRGTVYNKMKKFKIDPAQYRGE